MGKAHPTERSVTVVSTETLIFASKQQPGSLLWETVLDELFREIEVYLSCWS